jgi:hypothetical protein
VSRESTANFKQEGHAMTQTYYGSAELADSMRSVRRHTVIIAEDIPEERDDYRPAPGSRSVRETLLHMASMTQLDLRVHGEDRLESLEGFDFLRSFGLFRRANSVHSRKLRLSPRCTNSESGGAVLSSSSGARPRGESPDARWRKHNREEPFRDAPRRQGA